MNKTATIQLRNLTIGYKGKVRPKIVAENICSDIYAGELTCLLGTNGIGKIYGQGLIHGDQCRVDRKM